MKLINVLLLSIFFFPDIALGQVLNQKNNFKTIKIGNQVWMLDNLNVDRFRNGDLIKQAKTSEEWEYACRNNIPAWCYYDNDPSNGDKYGKLYNSHAITDSRGLAPEGYHIPKTKEFTTLVNFYGGVNLAGSKLKSISGWNENGNGILSNGFSAQPGGYRDKFGFYDMFTEEILLGKSTRFWCLPDDKSSYFNYLSLTYRNNSAQFTQIISTSSPLTNGLSVRCVKN